MGILDGKRILVTGVLTDSSIAFHVARIAQQEGARLVLTGFGRLSLVERIAKRLPDPPPVIELDVADEGQLSSLAERVSGHLDGLDGVVHAIGFAPQAALGGNFLQHGMGGRGHRAAGVRLLAQGTHGRGAATDAGRGLRGRPGLRRRRRPGPDTTGWGWPRPAWSPAPGTWPVNWGPGVSGSIWCRPARCGPWPPRAFPGSTASPSLWDSRAPLGWDINDAGPAARACVALLSDWFPATTGEIVHCDGGVHAVGA